MQIQDYILIIHTCNICIYVYMSYPLHLYTIRYIHSKTWIWIWIFTQTTISFTSIQRPYYRNIYIQVQLHNQYSCVWCMLCHHSCMLYIHNTNRLVGHSRHPVAVTVTIFVRHHQIHTDTIIQIHRHRHIDIDITTLIFHTNLHTCTYKS